MPLTALQVKGASPRATDYGLPDGNGLCLWVRVAGGKSWRFRFRLDGKQSHISLGTVDRVTLSEARQLAAKARALVAQGKHPGIERKVDRLMAATARATTFKALAIEWHEHKSARWSEGYAADTLTAFENDIFPHVGGRPIEEIKPLEWLAVFRKIESRGALEKLRKVRQRCAEVYRYAIVTGRATYNAVSDIGGALQAPIPEHYPFLRAHELPPLLQAISGYEGSLLVRLGARLLMLTGVRTSELRAAPWAEFDLDAGIWTIPAERMKKRRTHLVPLSRQALETLRELQKISGGYTLVFPGRNDPGKPMSEAAINQLLKKSGFDGKATGHGFRHTMSTILHDQGYSSAWVETQLAHTDRNTVRGTYNHAQYLDGRKKMLQWYADYLDTLESGSNVVTGDFGLRA